jgi:hypothetical protein
MSAVTDVWVSTYNSTLERAQNAPTSELRTHFEREAAQIKLTLDAMDITDPGDTPPGSIPILSSLPIVNAAVSTPSSIALTSSIPVVVVPINSVAGGSAPSSIAPVSSVASGSLPASSYAPIPSGTYTSDVDSNKKVADLWPLIQKAAEASGMPATLLAALMVKESRGKSIQEMQGIGGLMQCGEGEFNETAAKHPELRGLAWNSTEGQIMAAAFRISDFQKTSGSWDDAMTKYNGGAFRGGLVDPNYITLVHQFEDIIKSGGQLPS